MLKHDKPFKISTYLNKRQPSQTIKGHYKCYVRVYPYDRTFPTFFVTTSLSCSVDQYENMFIQSRKRLKPTNTQKFNDINKMVSKAESLNDYKVCRSPQSFKDKWNGSNSSGFNLHGWSTNINDCFNAKILELEETGQYGTRDTYNGARNSFIDYFGIKKFESKSFYDITKSVLINFHKWHLDKGNTSTTIGIHTRNLRHLFNVAIKKNIIENDCYPFGKDEYSTPKGEGTNRALSSDNLKAWWEYKPSTVARKKSQEIWFLSYFASGVNFKDLCYLKHSDVKESEIEFIRAKTEMKAVKKITVPRNEFINKMLKKNRGVGKYAFNFVNHKLNPEQRHISYKSKLRGHNKKFNIMTKLLGLKDNLSFYWGRHSFATKSRNDGENIGMISKAMGHSNIAQTEAYFNRYDEGDMKALQDNLSNF